MTFSVSTGHHWQYLTDQVSKGRENYYTKATDQGEPPGVWNGRGAVELGLSGTIQDIEMEALYGHFVDPRDPDFRNKEAWSDAAKLGRAPRRYTGPEEVLAKKLEAEPHATPERREQLRNQAENEARHAVAFLDATFSPPKSVTVLHTALRAQELEAQRAGNQGDAELWAQRAHAVEQAIWAGNNAGLEYWQDHAGYSRAGYHGRKGPDGASTGRYVDGHKWVIGSFYQHTSRAGDPQLHIHNTILNRVENPDENWRTLDSRAVHRVRGASAAIAERTMFEKLQRDLGVEVLTRPDGKSLEISTVPQAARELFSTRRQAVTERLATVVAQFEERYHHAPNALQLARLSQAVTLESRPGKSAEFKTVEEELDEWSERLRTEVDTTMERIAHESIARVDAADSNTAFRPDVVIEQAVAQVQDTKAAWTRYDLLRAINDKLPPALGGLDGDHVRALLEELTDLATNPASERVGRPTEVVRLTAPELVPVPAELRRDDGRSMFEPPAGEVYATTQHLRAEERLVRASERAEGIRRVTAERAEAVVDQARAAGRPLGDDQAAAVHGVLTSGRPLELLIGVAGSGKSFALGSLAKGWEQEAHGRVVGLATSQKAAQVLQDEGLRSTNIERWLDYQQSIDAGSGNPSLEQWRLHPGDLVIVDEAGMTPTAQLDSVRARAEAVGAKLLLAGDPLQLTAPGAGGALDLLAKTAQTYELNEVRRFDEEWERSASTRLRDRDPSVLPVYDRHGRVVDGGTAERAGELAAEAWLASTLAGERALLVVSTNEQAADLSDQLRARLVDLGKVEEGGELIGLHNGTDRLTAVAGVGDVIQARQNSWQLRDDEGYPVINRDLYRVGGRPGNGDLEVQRITVGVDGKEKLGPTVTLPAEYLQHHATLGYAVTEYGAQGATVHSSYSVVSHQTGASGFYVGMTRGVHNNVAFVQTAREDTSPPRVAIHDEAALQAGSQPSSALAVLHSLLAKEEIHHAALTVERENLEFAGSLGKLGTQWTVALEHLQADRNSAIVDQLIADGTLTAAQGAQLKADPAADTMWRHVRSGELAGHDPARLLATAIRGRNLDNAESVAKVLNFRIANRLEGQRPAGVATFAERTPNVDSEIGRWAQDLAQAMDARAQTLGERLAEIPEPWAERNLGPAPADPFTRDAWVERAGRIAAYREQYLEEPDKLDAIGPCPPARAPEARAAWYAAWTALGGPTENRPELELSVPELRERIAAYEREEAWAPRWVGEQLRETTLAAREYREHATIGVAEAQAEADPQVRGAIQTRAEAYADLADKLEVAQQQLELVDDARARWYLHTVDARLQAENARIELSERGVSTDDAERERGRDADDVETDEPVADAAVTDDAERERGRDADDVETDEPVADAAVTDDAERERGRDADDVETDEPVADAAVTDDAERERGRDADDVETDEPVADAAVTDDAERERGRDADDVETDEPVAYAAVTDDAERERGRDADDVETDEPVADAAWPANVPQSDELAAMVREANDALLEIQTREDAALEGRMAEEEALAARAEAVRAAEADLNSSETLGL